MSKSSITVGTVVTGGGVAGIYVDGEYVTAPNITGMALQDGQSVTVMRLGNGRYQILGYSGYEAPQPE
jgi:hypothetical protein